MKQILYTLLLFCTVGLFSCRKDKNELTIKQFDDQQIQNYISANGLTGMQRDLTTGDTTGMYYKILSLGTGSAIKYSDSVSLVFTLSSFDGQFIATDTIINHVENFLGHITQNNIPTGVQLAILNILKNKGGRMRLLVPSHLGYGSTGFGSGSSSGNNRITGNQCLDYYINVVNTDKVTSPSTGKKVLGQSIYDDQSIKNYIAANGLTGYIATGTGLYYKIIQPGVGNAITGSSIVTVQYTSTLFNGIVTSDQYNAADGSGTTLDLSDDSRRGLVEGIQKTLPGSRISLLIPSGMAYGPDSYSDSSIPVNSCLRYEINVITSQ